MRPARAADRRRPGVRRACDSALDEVHVGWAGSTGEGEPHYYRVQGPSILIEYNSTQRKGNHAHSVWRDPRSDFGMNELAAFRERALDR